MSAIDVVIPAHPKDFKTLRHCVRSVLRHVSPVRRVLVVSPEQLRWHDRRVVSVGEPAAPELPSLADVSARVRDRTRAGWIYQQLLKLGAPDYLDGLSAHFLVVDADLVFLRPVSFDPAELGRFPYSHAFEYHEPYLEAFERLVGEPSPVGFSLTAHHMLFDLELLAELKAELAERHGKPWHDAVLDAVDPDELASISEWNLYGLWVLARHPELARRRQLEWRDVWLIPGILGRAILANDFDFVAAHAWKRDARPRWTGDLVARIGAELWALRRLV